MFWEIHLFVSISELHEKTDTTVCALSMELGMVSLVLYKGWKQEETAGKKVQKPTYQRLISSLIYTMNLICLIRTQTEMSK